ncbi:MAG TPA: helix-turn-helix domain-containing protein [Gemmatimonadales bacterium]|nr:helix-turn-helix domain-containing protein [Gemmatimonadales bacterium]
MQTVLALLDADASAASLLDPVRREILAALQEPGSATSVAHRLGLPRQRLGYHIRQMEEAGLLRHVGNRRRGNFIERLLQASARSYFLPPRLLGALGTDPKQVSDKASSAYQVAVAAEIASTVATMREAAAQAGKRLPTLTMQVDVRFASPADQKAFGDELTAAISELVARYHSAEGRLFAFAILGHPASGEKGKGKRE